MNKCHVLKKISSYMDNELKAQEKFEVEEHLKSCRVCSQELDRLRILSEKLRAWHIGELGSGFDNSVRNEIVAQELERGEVKMKKRTLTILVPSGVIAGILVFLFVGQVYVKQGVQGKLRSSTDEIGQYEPYYLSKQGSGSKGYNFVNEAVSDMRITDMPVQNYVNGVGAADKMQALNSVLAEANRVETDHQHLATQASGKAAQLYTPPGEGPVIIIQPVLPATGEGEKIIRTAEVRLEVADGKEAYNQASVVCKELGGYLAASRFYKDKEGREAGTITMRIPKDKFLTALDKLGSLGKVESSYTNSHDVSQEYANLKSRLDAAMVVYNKMVEALQKRQVTIPEAMRLESELTPILQKIEGLKNQIESLNNAVSFTTITVNFHEPEVSVKVLKETKRYVQDGLLKAKINAVHFFANVIPFLFAIIFWMIVAAVVVYLVKYFIIKLLRK